MMNETNGETARKHLTSASNHWVLPTAASFGWTVKAAAANPLRYGSGNSPIVTTV